MKTSRLNRLNVVNVQKDANGKRDLRALTMKEISKETWTGRLTAKTIVFTRTRTPKVDLFSADLFAVDVTSGAVRALASTNAAESGPSFSPDGKSISLLVSDDPPRWAGYRRIAVIPAEGGAPRLLAENL